jgi:TonB family protein
MPPACAWRLHERGIPMPEGLLRGVPDSTRTSATWPVLPISVAAHVCAAVAFVVIPLAAEVEPPIPHRQVGAYLQVAMAKPLEVPLPRGSSTAPARVAPSSAPSVLPSPDTASSPITGSAPSSPGDPPGVPDGIIGSVGPIGDTIPIPPPPVAVPEPAQERKLVRVGGDISPPRKVVDVAPVYPHLAQSARVAGTVILEAVISERGAVERVRVLRSVPLLDRSAMDAVKQWRYTPTLLNNVPVPVLMTITVTFSLQR